MVSFLIGYAVLLLYFILQAIEALHPGRFRPSLKDWPADSPDFPIGVRYYEDVIKRTAAEHWAAWQHVRLSQLNAELAMQLHGLALKNDAKHRAVRRLFIGLRAMAFMLGAVLAMYLLFSLDVIQNAKCKMQTDAIASLHLEFCILITAQLSDRRLRLSRPARRPPEETPSYIPARSA